MISNFRGSDIVCRLGGDEFVVLLPKTNLEQSIIAINKIRLKLAEAMDRHGWPVTFSIGAVAYPHPPESLDEMICKADNLMYKAKRTGKNKFEIALPDENEGISGKGTGTPDNGHNAAPPHKDIKAGSNVNDAALPTRDDCLGKRAARSMVLPMMFSGKLKNGG